MSIGKSSTQPAAGTSAPAPAGPSVSATQTSPPPGFQTAYNALGGQAMSLASQPWVGPYPGQLVSQFTPQQLQAFNQVNQLQGQFAPFINAAGQAFGQATQPIWPTLPQYNVSGLPQAGISAIGQAPQYAAAAAQPIAQSVQPYAQLAQTSAASAPQNLAAFYSPFTQQVAGNLQNLFNQQNAQQLAQVAGSEVGQGAFGGDRQAVAEALTAQQQQLAQAPVMAQTLQQGFQAAQQQAAQQAALETQAATQGGQLMAGALGQQGQLGLGAGQLNLAAGQGLMQDFAQQQQAQMAAEQANAWLASQAGFGMGQLGQEQQALGLQGLGALEQAGLLQQQLQQYQLNVPYSEWQQMQAWPYQQLQFAAPIVEGVGSLSGGTAATSQAAPSTLSQLAGLGLTGAGILSATGGLSGLGNLFGGGTATPQAGFTTAASGGTGQFAPFSSWQTVTNPSDWAQLAPSNLLPTGKRGGRVGGYQAGGGIGTGTGLGSGGLSFDPSFPGELADVPIEPTDLIPTTSGTQTQGLRGTGPPGLGGGGGGVSGGIGGTGAASNPFQTGLQALQLGTGIGNTVQGLTSGTGFLGTIGSGIGSLVSGIGSIFGLEKGGAVDGYQAGGEMQQQQSPQPRPGGYLPVPTIPQSLIMPMDRVGAGPGPAVRGPGPPGGGSGPPQPPRPQESGFDPLKTLEDPSKSLPLIKSLFGKGTTPGGTSTSETSPSEAAEGGSYQAGGQIDPNMGFGMTADLLRAGGGGPNPMMDSLGIPRGGLAGGSFGSGSGINGPNLGFQIPHQFRLQEGGATGSEATTEPLLGETQTSGMMTPQMQGLLAQGQNMSIEQLQEAEAAHPQYAQLYNLIRMRKQLSSPMTAGQETSAAMASGLASGLPTSNLTTNFLPLVTQGASGQPAPVGGGSLLPTQTAAEGGDIRGPRNYVTEDELDPHPVVDHSGKTIVVHYPSEGKSLDLGLPTSFKQHARAKYGGRIRMQTGGATSPQYGELGGGSGFTGMPAGAFTGFNQGYPGVSGAGFNAPGRAPGFQFEPSQAGWYGAGAGYMPQFNPQRSALMSEIMQPTGNPFAGISPVQFPNVGQATAPQQMTYANLTGPQISGATYGLGANAQVQNPPAIPFSSLGVTPQNPNAWLNSVAAGVARGGRIRLQDGGSDTQDAPLDANTIELLRRSGLDPTALARIARAPSRQAVAPMPLPPPRKPPVPAGAPGTQVPLPPPRKPTPPPGAAGPPPRKPTPPGTDPGAAAWSGLPWSGDMPPMSTEPTQVPSWLTPPSAIGVAAAAPPPSPPTAFPPPPPRKPTPPDPISLLAEHERSYLERAARKPTPPVAQGSGLGQQPTTADELNRQELGLLQSGYRGPIPVSPVDELNRQQLSTVNPTGMQIGRTYFGPGVDPAYGTATGLGQQPPTVSEPHTPQQLHDYFYPKGEAGGWLGTGSFKPGWDRQPAGTGPARPPDSYIPQTDPATGVRYRAPGWTDIPTPNQGAIPSLVAAGLPQPPAPGQRVTGTPTVPWSEYATSDTTPTAPVTPVERTPLGPSVVNPSASGAAIGGRIGLQGGGTPHTDTLTQDETLTALGGAPTPPPPPAEAQAVPKDRPPTPTIKDDTSPGVTLPQPATLPLQPLPFKAPVQKPVSPPKARQATTESETPITPPATTEGPSPPVMTPPPVPASYQPQPPGIGATPPASAPTMTGAGLGSADSAYSAYQEAVDRALAKIHQHEGGDFYGSPGMAMMAAGLGMLGGGSPWAGVNIGRGGLQGLQMYAEQQRELPKIDLERAQAAVAQEQLEMLPLQMRAKGALLLPAGGQDPTLGMPGMLAGTPPMGPGISPPAGPVGPAPTGPVNPTLFTTEANKQGVDPPLVHATASIESDYGKNTGNKISPSNTGIFQMAKAGAPGGMNDSYENQIRLGVNALVQERDGLTKALGRTPTNAEVYLAHQQGVHGATALLNNPNAPAGQVVPPVNISNNGGNPNAPASQFIRHWEQVYANKEAPFRGIAAQPSADRPIQIAQAAPAGFTDAALGAPAPGAPVPGAPPMRATPPPGAPAPGAPTPGLPAPEPGLVIGPAGLAMPPPQRGFEAQDWNYVQLQNQIAQAQRDVQVQRYNAAFLPGDQGLNALATREQTLAARVQNYEQLINQDARIDAPRKAAIAAATKWATVAPDALIALLQRAGQIQKLGKNEVAVAGFNIPEIQSVFRAILGQAGLNVVFTPAEAAPTIPDTAAPGPQPAPTAPIAPSPTPAAAPGPAVAPQPQALPSGEIISAPFRVPNVQLQPRPGLTQPTLRAVPSPGGGLTTAETTPGLEQRQAGVGKAIDKIETELPRLDDELATLQTQHRELVHSAEQPNFYTGGAFIEQRRRIGTIINTWADAIPGGQNYAIQPDQLATSQGISKAGFSLSAQAAHGVSARPAYLEFQSAMNSQPSADQTVFSALLLSNTMQFMNRYRHGLGAYQRDQFYNNNGILPSDSSAAWQRENGDQIAGAALAQTYLDMTMARPNSPQAWWINQLLNAPPEHRQEAIQHFDQNFARETSEKDSSGRPLHANEGLTPRSAVSLGVRSWGEMLLGLAGR